MRLTQCTRDVAGGRSDAEARELQILVIRDVSFLENVVGRRRVYREVVELDSGVEDIYDRIDLFRPVDIRNWTCAYAVGPPELRCHPTTVGMGNVESILRDFAANRILR